MILVDSNVMIDLAENDPRLFDWSKDAIAKAVDLESTFINDIVIAEVAPSLGSLDYFFDVLEGFGIGYRQICEASAFAAGVAFLEYRKRKVGSKSILADFLIGGHAQALGATILTRDSRFYRAYFPQVPLMTPMKDEE